jgi:hypothetical protein
VAPANDVLPPGGESPRSQNNLKKENDVPVQDQTNKSSQECNFEKHEEKLEMSQKSEEKDMPKIELMLIPSVPVQSAEGKRSNKSAQEMKLEPNHSSGSLKALSKLSSRRTASNPSEKN